MNPFKCWHQYIDVKYGLKSIRTQNQQEKGAMTIKEDDDGTYKVTTTVKGERRGARTTLHEYRGIRIWSIENQEAWQVWGNVRAKLSRVIGKERWSSSRRQLPRPPTRFLLLGLRIVHLLHLLKQSFKSARCLQASGVTILSLSRGCTHRHWHCPWR